MAVFVRFAAALLLVAAACSDDSTMPDAEVSLVPADYSAFQEVRNCRASADHLLMRIRILTDPSVTDAYLNLTGPFPEGSIILKEERDPADTTCSGPIESWTIMVKQPAGTAPKTLDYRWQRVRASDNMVITEDEGRCASCHVNCVAPEHVGYTCADPP